MKQHPPPSKKKYSKLNKKLTLLKESTRPACHLIALKQQARCGHILCSMGRGQREADGIATVTCLSSLCCTVRIAVAARPRSLHYAWHKHKLNPCSLQHIPCSMFAVFQLVPGLTVHGCLLDAIAHPLSLLCFLRFSTYHVCRIIQELSLELPLSPCCRSRKHSPIVSTGGGVLPAENINHTIN